MGVSKATFSLGTQHEGWSSCPTLLPAVQATYFQSEMFLRFSNRFNLEQVCCFNCTERIKEIHLLL